MAANDKTASPGRKDLLCGALVRNQFRFIGAADDRDREDWIPLARFPLNGIWWPKVANWQALA